MTEDSVPFSGVAGCVLTPNSQFLLNRQFTIEKEAAMELAKAIEIVKSLADGLDPTSHQPLISESVYQNTDTARALYTAVQVLEESRQREERKAQLPPNAGRAWDDAEDKQLCDEFHRAVAFDEMAQVHCRTRGAIISRLVKLGKIHPRSEEKVA